MLVDREDGTGAYNLMVETHDGKTMTRQLTNAQAVEFIAGALSLLDRVTKRTF